MLFKSRPDLTTIIKLPTNFMFENMTTKPIGEDSFLCIVREKFVSNQIFLETKKAFIIDRFY